VTKRLRQTGGESIDQRALRLAGVHLEGWLAERDLVGRTTNSDVCHAMVQGFVAGFLACAEDLVPEKAP
jgi:hypothetical protein